MKTYIIESSTNYGLYVHIVNAETPEEAKAIALVEGAWDGCDVHEICTTTKGLVHAA